MFKNVASEIIFNIVSMQRIRDWIKRKIYPLSEFRRDIIVDTRPPHPISFILNTEIPVVRIYLTVSSKSQYLDAIFDRLVFLSVDINSNGLRRILSEKHVMPLKTIYKKQQEEILCSFELNERQIEVLKGIDKIAAISANLLLEYHIDSSLYSFSDRVTLEGRPCEII